MPEFKIITTKHHTYYFGCLSNNEKTETEKEEFKYMFIQKSLGVLSILLAVVSIALIRYAPDIGVLTLIMVCTGIGLLVTKKHVIFLS